MINKEKEDSTYEKMKYKEDKEDSTYEKMKNKE